MNGLTEIILLVANSATFVLSLSVLILALWQNPGTPLARALNQFLASLVFLSLTVILILVNTIFLGNGQMLDQFATNLALTAFALSSLLGFSLIVHAAGQMKERLQVVARAGMVALVLLQWPLWTNQLFTQGAGPTNAVESFTEAGKVAAVVNMLYIVMGLALGYTWRRRINQPALLLSVSVLLIGHAFTLILAPLRVIAFPSLLVSFVCVVLGYNMVRLQLFSPLLMRTAQVNAVRALSQAMMSRQGLNSVLDTVVNQTQAVLKTGVATVMLVDPEGSLVVAAQQGGTKRLIGRKLRAGEGLSGRVMQMQQAMSLPNYRSWEGRSSVFDDVGFYASLSAPLIDGDDLLGVLNIHELEAGRIYGERDRAVVEMLAAQAALGIMHERLLYEVIYWRTRAKDRDKSAPHSFSFDENGKLVLAFPQSDQTTE